MIWSRSKVEVKGQGTLRRVLVARFADLPGQNTFPGFEIFPVARLSEFPGFVVFPGSIFPVVSRFLASGQVGLLRDRQGLLRDRQGINRDFGVSNVF